MHLLQQACSREPVITYSDVYRTLEALLTLAAGTPGQTLVSQVRMQRAGCDVLWASRLFLYLCSPCSFESLY